MSELNLNETRFDTQAIHAGYRRDSDYGALATPIYQTSTFTFPSADYAMKVFSGEIPGYDYTRAGNPTVRVFEEKIAQLEGGEDAVATSSGMGAISSALLGLFQMGDHIVCGSTVYGCTDVVMREILPSLGITATFVDTGDLAAVEAAIQPNTKAIYFETPANPTMQVTDIAAVSALKQSHPGLRVIVDNTFAPPPVQRPLSLGADVVVHSVTKYINGHGDVIGGVVVGTKGDIAQVRSRAMGKICGTPLTPFSAYLIIRGMKTLGLRVRRHCENALALAQYLETCPEVEKVYYPGLPSMGKDYEIARRQMNGLYSGIFSFVLKEGTHGLSAFDAAKKLMDNLKIPAIAVSLGDPDTLIQHPASMTHVKVPKQVREQVGITDGMLRFSVGLEDVEDLKADFAQAFARL
ncbi:MAG TPA: PLP-dependent aspartate aminotransferase family protein [Candidatus Anaerotruncus excrementipullorum]|uniref:homocysteine desulfhydrase n=1 Tax=Candidatus Anaerotruncus excrementipullorum TaxID=2838465 RepID=A0A9D1WSS6_9FIRM|nr:PLP-dependent aspartate aminotransferase family protein [Candidatus Anaerotruncus excrementipullorum]